MRNLNKTENYDSITQWLNENLDCNRSLIPHFNDIPNLKSKGIYFWFMKIDGYEELSQFVPITPIQPRYIRIIDGVKYDLVYLGTAGTGKNGNSNLAERLRWHINQAHTKGNICHGTLSTLRAGLGALLADDLIYPDSESLVNLFMKNYMKVFWIEYPDNILLIDNDEDILIKILRPLLNIKNNPNALAIAPLNATRTYKTRRMYVYEQTRQRLECNSGRVKVSKKTNPDDQTPNYDHQIISDNLGGCIEYSVMHYQHIHEVTRGITGLWTGRCQIYIKAADNSNREFTNWTRRTGNNNNPNAQNIYTYFGNTSTEGPTRSLVIHRWMEDENIDEITVRVCQVFSDNLNSTKNNVINELSSLEKEYKKKPKNAINDMEQNKSAADEKIKKCLNNINWDNLNDNKNPKLLIIGCCGAKTVHPLLGNGDHLNYDFGLQINNARTNRCVQYAELMANPQPANYFNETRDGHEVDVNYFQNALNGDLTKALDLYGNNHTPFFKPVMKQLYYQKIENCNLHLLIVSGLYGVVKYSDYINDYHFEIGIGQNVWGNSISQAIKNYVIDNNIENNDVFYSLSDPYLQRINPPNEAWNNLWIQHGHGHASAKCVSKFLRRL